MNIGDFTLKYRSQLIKQAYKKWVKRGDKILDIGCGNGVVSEQLSKKLAVEIVGCDVLSYSRTKIPFVVMKNADKLPFSKRSFDAAMFNDVLHHMTYKNQNKLLAESLRVANKVLIFELKPTLIGKILDFLINKLHNSQMFIPFTYKSINDWKTEFKKLKVEYQLTEIRRPLFYPFSHVAFCLCKKL